MKQISLFLALAYVLTFVSNAKASISGEAFWGSFGEGAGRVECVIFKSEDGSQLIGYDEETETGFFSTNVSWDDEADFSFEGISIKESSTVASSGRGLVGATLSANDTLSSHIEGSIGDEDLAFQTFASSEAVYYEFDLIGQQRSSLKVVSGGEGVVYVLFVDEEGLAYGGEVLREEGTDDVSFLTPEGDEFVFDLDSISGSFELVDGSNGVLANVATEVEEREENWVEQLWLTESKLANRGSSAVHFIIEGEGTAQIDIEALVSVVDASPAWLFSYDVTIGLYRMTSQDEYELLFESSSLNRVKMSDYSLLDLEGLLNCQLGEGTYLVQISGIYEARSVTEVEVSFDEKSQKNGLRIINMSTLYIAGQVEGERSFGFRLAGEAVSKAVVRNVGPSLSSFEIPSHTVDPLMAISRNGTKSWKNDDWWQTSTPSQLSTTMRSLGAFDLGDQSKDAAAKLTLEAGDYEVTPQGSQKDSAYELIEIYFDEA
ncbi:hypothetical protein MLD52_04590 [Puniceicoccaceae bacterium K14]|nr:hypothetical protein [Puniceicoccaceae bacterium K14]